MSCRPNVFWREIHATTLGVDIPFVQLAVGDNLYAYGSSDPHLRDGSALTILHAATLR